MKQVNPVAVYGTDKDVTAAVVIKITRHALGTVGLRVNAIRIATGSGIDGVYGVSTGAGAVGRHARGTNRRGQCLAVYASSVGGRSVDAVPKAGCVLRCCSAEDASAVFASRGSEDAVGRARERHPRVAVNATGVLGGAVRRSHNAIGLAAAHGGGHAEDATGKVGGAIGLPYHATIVTTHG